MRVYRITPLEKKNVEITYDVFEEKDNSVRGWNVKEMYRWGLGYRLEDDPVSEWEANNNGISCNPEVGSGAELDDRIYVEFEFDEDFTDEEKQEIEKNWYEGGAGWLYDGDHDWQEEYVSLVIYGPVKIDLIDDSTNEIIEENVQPKHDTANLSWQTVSDEEMIVWPFPTGKGETKIE
jgi:hypothetical protein